MLVICLRSVDRRILYTPVTIHILTAEVRNMYPTYIEDDPESSLLLRATVIE